MNAALQWIAVVGGTLGGGKFLVDVVLSRSTARKVRAEGRKVDAEGSVMLVDSATGWAQKLTERVDKVTAEFDQYRLETERRQRKLDNALRLHSAWDYRVRAQLVNLGSRVPPPPPLIIND